MSVILPTFNRLQYLRAAIASVFEQTLDDWELLIADDGSGPEAQAYLRTLDDPPRVKVLWLSHTGNPAAVRNAALCQAKGEYVAFLDSDDVWMPEKLETQIASLRSHPGREWSYTGFILVDHSGNPVTGTRAKRCPAIDGQFLEPLVKGEPRIVQSSVVVRRELLQKVEGYDEELTVCGDYELWIRLAQHSEIDFIDRSLVLVRHGLERYFDDVTAMEDLRRMLEKVQRSGAASHLDAVLQKRRAQVSAGLARGHAVRKRRLRMLSTLFSSAHYSWRYPEWWFGALAAMAHAFAPPGMLTAVRRYRSGGRAKIPPQT